MECHNGVVVSVSGLASDVGVSVLKRGGNAVDAAVATAFALAVTYPAAGNIGGGGFMLVHPAPGEGEPMAYVYRETAPAAAFPTMFSKEDTQYMLQVGRRSGDGPRLRPGAPAVRHAAVAAIAAAGREAWLATASRSTTPSPIS